jgi:acetylornithine deacetylase/succinyl-diaminopimelate desuccinylase-like protein
MSRISRRIANMKTSEAKEMIGDTWEKSIVPKLEEYIRIPCKSPSFDAAWEANGHLDRAITLIEAWCKSRNLEGLKLEIVRLPGRTPLLFMELGPEGGDTVMLYGHYDKQPEMTGWAEGLGPWNPVRRGDRLYGRGGADDGYAAFASLAAIEAVRRYGGRHNRCVILIEGCEESGSFDLPHYVKHLKSRIGDVSLVVCLDSGSGNYDQLWMTTSLRGLVGGTLTVDVLTQGVHSGDASGIVPSSFRIVRQLLDRVEDSRTGKILIDEAFAKIPEERIAQASIGGQTLVPRTRFPFAGDTVAMASDASDLALRRTWTPFLSVTGAGGLPALANAGNVLRPSTSLKLSLRIPPRVEGKRVADRLKAILETDPPSRAQVRFHDVDFADGWDAPPLSPWLAKALDEASRTAYDKPAAFMGEGGTIPFMAMLGSEFPNAQFMITGVLGPESNAHGPDEFLHIEMGKRLTQCVAHVLDAHARRS